MGQQLTGFVKLQIVDSGAMFWSLTKSFGGNLRELRKPKYKRSKDFAKALGVSPAIVSRWERDGTGPPEAGTLIRLASTIGCSIDALLDGVDGYVRRDLPWHDGDQQSGHDSTSARILELETDVRRYQTALGQVQDVASQLVRIAAAGAQNAAAPGRRSGHRSRDRKTG